MGEPFLFFPHQLGIYLLMKDTSLFIYLSIILMMWDIILRKVAESHIICAENLLLNTHMILWKGEEEERNNKQPSNFDCTDAEEETMLSSSMSKIYSCDY